MAAISSGIFAGAMLSQVVTAGAAVAGAAAGTAMSIKSAQDQKKALKQSMVPTPTYDAEAEKKKAANQEAEANRKRILTETDTVKTTALGNTGTTEVRKKTLLGG